MTMIKGTIFNIQRYSVNDGPGIRTTVFLKGCPLTCWWCHNPESQSADISLIRYPELCISCGQCKLVCEHPDQCQLCGQCASACPTESRRMVGKQISVDELYQEIAKDILFYEESGGGVTFSGGEPLSQPEFLIAILKRCHEMGIHTVVDTSGFADPKIVKTVAEHTDLWLYDVKHMDSEQHQKLTGVSNKIILENLKQLISDNRQVIIRVPVIPTCNDSEENIRALAEFLLSLPRLTNINILQYHKLAEDKHQRFTMDYRLQNIEEPTEAQMNKIKKVLERYAEKVTIGG